MASESLFSSDLLSPAVSEALPQGYKIRSLRRTDYNTGFLDCLRVLTTVGDISQSQWEEQYDWFKQRDGSYYMLVVEDDKDQVVGCGTLVVERKLYVYRETPVRQSGEMWHWLTPLAKTASITLE